MRIFIWSDVDKVSESWHADGGIAVIDETLEDAREAIRKKCPNDCEALKVDPDLNALIDAPKSIFIFPNAGCC